MNKDFRLSVGFMGHPKTIKLRRRCGADAVLSLITLFGFTAQNKPDGRLTGMSDEDIGIAAGWDGEPSIFVSALMEIGFLECPGDDDPFSIHDWAMHNGYAANAQSRTEHSRSAAESRWKAKRSKPNDATGNAPSINGHSGEHDPALPNNANGNAPVPYPSPVPVPSPFPLPIPDLSTTDVFAFAPSTTGSVAVSLAKVAEWQDAYPALDVPVEVKSCVQWMKDNPDKGIGPKPIARIGSWLRNAKPKGSANEATMNIVQPDDDYHRIKAINDEAEREALENLRQGR